MSKAKERFVVHIEDPDGIIWEEPLNPTDIRWAAPHELTQGVVVGVNEDSYDLAYGQRVIDVIQIIEPDPNAGRRPKG